MHYKPSGVCATGIDIETGDGIIKEVRFTNGCSGNTQGISRLVQGMEIDEAIKRLSGIRCGFKSTSCPDQLAKALIQIKNEAG
ncbi:MAG: TIGR03905 family TSCPD domain-containing protein [Lachnospiraceae bacterium]|nr:TIGR03905 family TSCPD domain-containing protein [Lachnospiraceae bacterium]